MKSRFFTLASSLLAFLGIGLTVADGAPPKMAPHGYIRFWNMLPAVNGPMDFRRVGSAATEAALMGASPFGRYNSYLEYPPGIYPVTICKTGQPQTAFGLAQVTLAANTYFTVLAEQTARGATLQAINDTNDPKATSGTLTVRNYFQGLTVDVYKGASKIVSAIPYGSTVVVSDLPLDRVELTLRTILPNKKAAESSAEADFKLTKRATLLIIPDDYGRFRPRVTLDGTLR